MLLALILPFIVLAVTGLSVEKISVEQQSTENRIAGGQSALPGQFPYIVGVRFHKPILGLGKITSWCGGSLISEIFVITAAHCVKGASYLEIILGKTDLSKEENGSLTLEVGSEYIISHEDYNGAQGFNDIALIKLPRPVQLSRTIKTVNLPRLSQRSYSFEKVIGWTAGWGVLGDRKPTASVLQLVRRWILPSDYCTHSYPLTFKSKTEICLDGSYGASACRGDSGGPLVVDEGNGSKILVGLTSYGKFEGCEKGFPAVFTRITAYLDWIAAKGGIKLRV
uniref:Venom polypeptide n=1 Tax=Dolopus genitalis TaxID=2488630 RepID=A0A3G5BIL2_DOLGE|nr:venom polypeptide [Dolopus genitalis]